MAEAAQITTEATAARAWPKVVRRILAFVAGAIFVYAGVIKVFDPLRFASDITNYQILPWAVAVRLAFFLPWLELWCGLALIFYRLFRGAVVLMVAMMLVFIGASIIAKLRGIDVSCGCFGSASSNLSFTSHLVLDFSLLAVLLIFWFWRSPAIR
ncbi:MAG TPA: MauE/DoxX family redox-associated membrane protein [Chthoniobacterales bacterium]|jgi:uncharacterized membrane protein YphA (DoxX/SURF4 family)